MSQVPAEGAATTRSVCPYCGVGCGVLIQSDRGRITSVSGDPDHPANFGRLCTKGSALHLSAAAGGRALSPELRRSREQTRTACQWDDALELIARRLAEIIRTEGPDAVAFYVSGQLLTEEYYVFNKLAKGLIGTNNIDTNSRLCMSSAVSGYKATLGADAPPACYEDIDLADLIFIAGSNTAYAHPILFRRIEAARQSRPSQRLIVVDPRRTDTAALADLHLAVIPGTDVALFNGILHLLTWDGALDEDFIARHTEGFDALRDRARDYPPRMVAELCGISETDLTTAARWFAESPAVLSLYCQGLNQSSHGTDKNAALINLHLATGKIGKPGCGPLSLTGQPNAMGGREVGGMATMLSGHRELANPVHRAEVAALWGVTGVPSKPGRTAVEMFEAVRAGEIKALWIACTNPAQSMPNQRLVHEALAAAELVIVQEAFADTETVQYADVLLPAASWGEKEGTMTNSERRISHIRPAVQPPGAARADWEIVVDCARRLESCLRPGLPTLFPYYSVEQIFIEHRETTRGRDLDITGLSYALLDGAGPQQWPCLQGSMQGTARLYDDGHFPTPSGRARFVDVQYRPVAEQIDARFPLRLNTGRLRDQWHGMSRSGKVASLWNHVEEPVLSISSADMARRQIVSGDLVQVRSRRGEIVLRANACEELRPGEVFLPMHWGGKFMRGRGINELTLAVVDPISGQPELKHCAVQVQRARLPWTLVAIATLSACGVADPGAALEAVRSLGERFDFFSCGLFGLEQQGVVLRAACASAPAEEVLLAVDLAIGLHGAADVMRYDDSRRTIGRRIRIQDDGIVALRLSGDTTAQRWLKEWIEAGNAVGPLGACLLAPTAEPPEGFSTRGRMICNCLRISEREIRSALERFSGLKADEVFSQLQAHLGCGTQCGSCIPEVRRLAISST